VDVNEVRFALVVATWELHVCIFRYMHKFIYKDIDATMSTSIQVKHFSSLKDPKVFLIDGL